MNEKSVQNTLFHHYMRVPSKTRFAVVVPNFKGAYDWECDLFGVDWSGNGWEWEVKRDEYDLRRDFTDKIAKHHRLKMAFKSREKLNVPSRFYFVLSDFSVDLKSIPDYIGVISMYGTQIKVLRDAPKLSAKKIAFPQLLKSATSLTWRYWKMRLERGLRSI